MVYNYTLALHTSVRPHLSVLGSCRLQDDPRERRGALSSYRIRYAMGDSPIVPSLRPVLFAPISVSSARCFAPLRFFLLLPPVRAARCCLHARAALRPRPACYRGTPDRQLLGTGPWRPPTETGSWAAVAVL